VNIYSFKLAALQYISVGDSVLLFDAQYLAEASEVKMVLTSDVALVGGP